MSATLGPGIYRKGEDGWETARLGWNRLVERRPELVVRATAIEHVRSALSIARSEGLRVAVQSSGHGAGAGLGSLEGALLLDMSGLRTVTVDPDGGTARVESGVLWQEVVDASAPFGLTALMGSSPNVAVTGYCLGGGVSFLGRRYGLAANNVLAIDVVLPDGTELRADATREPELFWALRGGGGSFAVVTSLELRLFPVSHAYAGFMFWPVECARDVLSAWLEWTRDVPDGAGTMGRVLQVPPLPQVPEIVRGRSLAGFCGMILDDNPSQLLGPLRDLRPEIDTFQDVAAPALTRISLDPEPPSLGIADGWVVDSFDQSGLDAFLSAVPPAVPSALLVSEIRHLGGALSHPSESQGCAGVMGGDYAVGAIGMGMTPEMAAAVDASIARLESAVRPWVASRQFPNFGARPDPSLFFGPEDLARLRAARRRYDPEGRLLSNRRID